MDRYRQSSSLTQTTPKIGHMPSPGHCRLIRRHHLLLMEFTNFGFLQDGTQTIIMDMSTTSANLLKALQMLKVCRLTLSLLQVNSKALPQEGTQQQHFQLELKFRKAFTMHLVELLTLLVIKMAGIHSIALASGQP